ncbi:MAG: hypothetical protein IJ815_08140 [Lachnospiraceae bacterium]|nr:hypothetical protein [Lachnospiraceae bacterium]
MFKLKKGLLVIGMGLSLCFAVSLCATERVCAAVSDDDLVDDTDRPYEIVYENSSDSSSSSSDSDDDDKKSSGRDEYDAATSTDKFIVPAATWVTPTCKYGEGVFVVLPITNMFKYNIKNVVVTPVISAKTDEFPFEIDSTGFTQKIDTLLGYAAEPDRNKRAQNCVWAFRTRENVKTGYYKLDFTVTYDNPVNNIESCTISTYVRTVGQAKYGTTDGTEENAKKSTPRIIVKGFTTIPAEVQAGENFVLNLTIQNTSKQTAVNNMQLDLTGIVAGKDEASSYAAFLPTSGANSFYVESIPAGGTKELSMEFSAKSDLEQKPYVMSIKMQYEDELANPYEGEASVSIPVHQVAKFDMSTPDIQPSSINVGEQSNVMFSIYNTGKTKLYNVSVSVNAPSLEPALAYVGGIESGGTGNVDMMLTGIAPTDNDGSVDMIISYEDEAGNATLTTKTINLFVTEGMDDSYNGDADFGDMDDAGMDLPMWQKVLIGVGGVVLLLIMVILILRHRKKRLKKLEEAELSNLDDEEEIDDEND